MSKREGRTPGAAGGLWRDLLVAMACGVTVAATAGMVIAGAAPGLVQKEQGSPIWWDAGSGRTFRGFSEYADADGKLGILVDGGPIATAGHPFFTPLGTNGRACITCHQPADGMSISPATLKARWAATHGKDPVFAAVDGSNCPSLRQDLAASHSLLLQKGLFRIYLPWPGAGPDGRPIEPEFKIEVVRDPTGCNTDPVYGLHSPHPTISVFRRPRVVANLKYVVNDFDPGAAAKGQFNIKTGMPLAVDPQTGRSVTMELMADSRAPTLRLQAVDAVLHHEEGAGPPTPAQLDGILDFESRVFSAQSRSKSAGDLTVPGGPPGLGPASLQKARPRLLGDYLDAPVFQTFDAWAAKSPAKATDPESEFRASVARGAKIYMTRTFWIRDAVHLNTIGLGNPIRRTCATCHNAQMTGMDLAPGWMDIGTNNLPHADPRPDLPLFKLTCDPDKPPHPFLGRVVYTHDPGRALITGKCIDIGSITMQQFRGLAARAPYFADGSAKDLRALVDYYDRRFRIKYSEQEKQDLVNFLSVL